MGLLTMHQASYPPTQQVEQRGIEENGARCGLDSD